jgi:Mg-chelatase subunit ChlD
MLLRKTSKLCMSGLVTIAAMAATACNDTNFKSDTVKRSGDNAQGKASEKVLNLECEPGQAKAELITDVQGAVKTTVRLSGEFCGVTTNATSGELTTLFIIDTSGSMQVNDPLVAGSCGRLRAAEAIVKKLEADAANGATVSMGAVHFGGTSTQAVTVRSLAEFKASVTTDTFCRDDGGNTNYEAAFTEATTMMTGVEGAKAVYFISDGEPTASNTIVPIEDVVTLYEVGRKAAETLRQTDQNLVLNAIYIQGTPVGPDPFNPNPIVPPMSNEAYLEQITGSKDRVRLVTNVDEIAAEIITFDTPDVVTLEKDSVAGTIEADGFDSGEITIATLEAHPSKDGVWIFETEPFELYSTTSDTTTNVVTLTIKGSDGKTYTAEAEINFGIE